MKNRSRFLGHGRVERKRGLEAKMMEHNGQYQSYSWQ
jgi:hypothetical protein